MGIAININYRAHDASTLALHVGLARGGGHLYLKLDTTLVKKNHVIRVVFQDQAMYARTSLRGAKTCKIGKKGVFFVILTNFQRT